MSRQYPCRYVLLHFKTREYGVWEYKNRNDREPKLLAAFESLDKVDAAYPDAIMRGEGIDDNGHAVREKARPCPNCRKKLFRIIWHNPLAWLCASCGGTIVDHTWSLAPAIAGRRAHQS